MQITDPKPIPLGELPPGAIVRGTLYEHPYYSYELGDVFEIVLPNGFVFDLGFEWCQGEPAFTATLYFEYFGNKLCEWTVHRPEQVPEGMRQILEKVRYLEKISE